MKTSSKLLLKVCGLKTQENIQAVAMLQPDFIGFIFYPLSPRHVEDDLPQTPGVRRVGVFVNTPTPEIMRAVNLHALDFVQLHGQESVEQCRELRENNIKVIKAFSFNDEADFSIAQQYETVCNYFLFDTKGVNPGGNSKQFNWSILSSYTGTIPFFLSGGIGEEDIHAVKKINHKMLYAIDVNSRVEISPGIKDTAKIKRIQQQL